MTARTPEAKVNGHRAPGIDAQKGNSRGAGFIRPDVGIPAIRELAEIPHWVAWQTQKRRGTTTKPPICAVPGPAFALPAKVSDPGTWTDFETVCKAIEGGNFEGLGFVLSHADLSQEGLVFIDLDDCRDPDTGEITPEAQEIVRRLNSYTEISPSGTGLHILVRGRLDEDGGRKDTIEIYINGRYTTVTSRHLEGTPRTIERNLDGVTWAWETYIRPSTVKQDASQRGDGHDKGAAQAAASPVASRGPNDRLLFKISSGREIWQSDLLSGDKNALSLGKLQAFIDNDANHKRTWERKRKDFKDQSLSTYDSSLACMAVYLGWQPQEIAALIVYFREQHGDDQGKTERPDYLTRTVYEAIDFVADQQRQRGQSDRVTQDEVEAGERADGHPVIKIRPGKRHLELDEGEKALGSFTLASPERGIYKRGSLLVRPARIDKGKSRRKPADPAKPTQREEAEQYLPDPLGIVMVSPETLGTILGEAADWVKFDGRSGKWKPDYVPKHIASDMHSRQSWENIPSLNGVIEAPTLRRDGTVIDQPGYDPSTGLFYDPGPVTFAPVPERPTREQALAALAMLKELIKDFPFVSDVDRSVALSELLAAQVRRSLDKCPFYAFNAPETETGKSLLADLGALLATGTVARLVPPLSSSTDDEERKRLLALFIEGPHVVVMDNVVKPLNSDALCAALTAEYFTDRLLGSSKTATAPTNILMSATGNNLQIIGDLQTRSMVCNMDAKMERPGERPFDVNLYRYIPAHRWELVPAALTVIRAYLAAGSPQAGKLAGLNRFGQWSSWCREPLVWLGEADPYANTKTLRDEDPERSALGTLLKAWHGCMPGNPLNSATHYTVRKLLASIPDVLSGENGGPEAVQAARKLHEQITEIGTGPKPDVLDFTAIGHFLKRNAGRVVHGFCLNRGKPDPDRGKATYFVTKAEP